MPSSGRKFLAWVRLLPVLLVLFVLVFVALQQIYTHTGGKFTLPWDESYINVATGKNLGFFGVWGLSKYSFQAAASSLAYPILLAPIFFIAGAYLVIPIIINAIATILLLKVLQSKLTQRGLPLAVQLAVLLLIILLTPLPFLIVSGTEYSLFLLLTALLLDASMAGKKQWLVWVYSFLLVSTRLEGLLVVAVVCGLLLCRRRQAINALKIGLAAILPIILFGLIFMSKGGTFVPTAFFRIPYPELYRSAITGVLLIMAIMALPLQGRRQWVAYGLIGVFAIFRTTTALQTITAAVIDTWHQQIPPAQFVHRYYNRYGITLNQLGAVSWFSEGRKVDLTGQADQTLRPRKNQSNLSHMNVDSLSRELGAHIAIYTGTQPFVKPDYRWDKIASWDVPGNIVSFYALDTTAGRILKQHMEEYRSMLPEDVQIRYY